MTSWQAVNLERLATAFAETLSTNMPALSMQAAAIPRFLLPQASWTPRAIGPVARGVAEARRQRHSSASARHTVAPSITTALQQQQQQQQQARRWQIRPAPLAAGRGAALGIRRGFSATAAQARDHHFDTLKFVQRLKEEGFTEEQAEGMMRVLSDVIEER